MSDVTAGQLRIIALFENMLGRVPHEHELINWSQQLLASHDFFSSFETMTLHPEFRARRRVRSAWLPGHFYSPIVDPDTVVEYVAKSRAVRPADIAGVVLDVTAMLRFWRGHSAFIAATPFVKEPSDKLRFYWRDSPYPIGDAVIYRAMINALRPKRIVEIGSGFSSACALDTLDEIGSIATMTCIEPFPQALQRRLRPTDYARVNVIASVVQDVPLDVYDALERNDILFIDSTHVLKTGSDVHHEFFSVLPRLKAGVMIHLHDIRWPFEYPDPFIFERNFSWNEAYALRALLMYSDRFSVEFYNSLFATEHEALAKDTFADFLINPGSSIWIKVN